MKALDVNMETWEDLASNCSDWRSTLRTQLLAGEKVLAEKAAEKSVHAEKMLCEQTNKQL